jgi:transcription antitermination protein NusB
MKSRHRAREIALQILYRFDSSTPNAQQIIQDLKFHFEHFQVHDAMREFIAQLVTGTVHHITALDTVLEKHAVNWKVSRMSSVDRSLLRMAVYEMLYMKDDVAPSIVIDEAIELAKQFGTSDTPAFVNGILDSIKAKEVPPTPNIG